MAFNSIVIISQWNGVIVAAGQAKSGTVSTARRSATEPSTRGNRDHGEYAMTHTRKAIHTKDTKGKVFNRRDRGGFAEFADKGTISAMVKLVRSCDDFRR